MMIRNEKINFFEKQLADFFRKTGRVELPWRRKNITAYEVWVSEIMLQQTQVVRVIGYYKRFLQRFSTVKDLAKVTWEEFLPYYEGLGYYARGRNMLKAAQTIMQEYDGKFPRDKKLLEQLPGIGPYTASAIMSFAYGEDHLAWDTNLKRVIGRFFLGGKHLVTDEAFWEGKLAGSKKEMNSALMDFGSALCVARPKCQACSLRERCIYYRENGVQESRSAHHGFAVRKHERVDKAGRDGTGVRTMVFLHEHHKVYFSSDTRRYRPFILPIGCVTRASIKEYFLKQYGLTLSVRPPHAKRVWHGRVTLCVNAQILLGTPSFALFTKKDVTRYNSHSA